MIMDKVWVVRLSRSIKAPSRCRSRGAEGAEG